MPEYICKCCDFQTKIKTHYIRHLKTKKHQKKKLSKDWLKKV